MNAVGTGHAIEVSSIRRPLKSLTKLWAQGTALAILLVSAAYLLANSAGDPLTVEGLGVVTLANILGLTLFGATVGAVLAYLFGRFARSPRMTFRAVTVIALAGYAVVPFTAAESVQTAIWLNVFHVVVAIPVIGMLARYLPGSRTSTEP